MARASRTSRSLIAWMSWLKVWTVTVPYCAHNAESEQHLKRALELRPDLHAAKLNLSALYIQTERYEEAVALSKELLADATFPVPWKAYGLQDPSFSVVARVKEPMFVTFRIRAVPVE